MTKEATLALEFANNSEPRCACVLLLDTSSSMAGAPIDALNAGVQTFKDAVTRDPVTSLRVDIAVVEFNSAVTVVHPFSAVSDFTPPTLQAGGSTSMGRGICQALDLIEARKDDYKQADLSYFRPWLFLITDGAATDSIAHASQRVNAAEARQEALFFAVGVEAADMSKLAMVAPPTRPPLKVKGLHFAELFRWLSKSLEAASQEAPDQNPRPSVSDEAPGQTPLPPVGWAEI